LLTAGSDQNRPGPSSQRARSAAWAAQRYLTQKKSRDPNQSGMTTGISANASSFIPIDSSTQ